MLMPIVLLERVVQSESFRTVLPPKSLPVPEAAGMSHQNVSFLEGNMEHTNFKFRCAQQTKKLDAACQGCFALAIAVVQASRKRCVTQEKDELPLYNKFLSSYFDKHDKMIPHKKMRPGMFNEFTKYTVEGDNEGPTFASNFIFAKLNKGVPGATAINDIKCRILSKVSQSRALRDSESAALPLTGEEGQQHIKEFIAENIGNIAEGGTFADINQYAQGINGFCSQALEETFGAAPDDGSHMPRCACVPWPRLEEAAENPREWVVQAAECALSPEDPC